MASYETAVKDSTTPAPSFLWTKKIEGRIEIPGLLVLLFRGLLISPRLEVPRGSRLQLIISFLWIGLESDFSDKMRGKARQTSSIGATVQTWLHLGKARRITRKNDPWTYHRGIHNSPLAAKRKTPRSITSSAPLTKSDAADPISLWCLSCKPRGGQQTNGCQKPPCPRLENLQVSPTVVLNSIPAGDERLPATEGNECGRVFLYSLATDDAFDVEAKPPDAQVVLADTVFLERVELLSSEGRPQQTNKRNQEGNSSKQD